MRCIAVLLISFMIVSCGKKTHENKKQNAHIDPKDLIGIWGVDDNENAIFRIDKDSILYVDPNTTYDYSISDDTLKIYQEGLIDKSLILKINEDSLVLKSLEYDVIQRYKRR